MSAQVIGYLGENGVRDVRIPIGHLLDKWPGLRPSLVMVPVGGSDDEAYPVQYTMDGTDLVWHVSDEDTAVAGTTKAAVRMVDDGGRVGKDEPFQVIISPNLSSGGEPPVVIKPWVDKLITLVPRAEEAAKRAENAAQNWENGTASNSNKLGGKPPEYYLPAVNLLSNPDFAIAQAGYNGLHGNVIYAADRWRNPNGLSAVKNADGLSVTFTTGGSRINQVLDPTHTRALVGKPITIAACVDGTVLVAQGMVPSLPSNSSFIWRVQNNIYLIATYIDVDALEIAIAGNAVTKTINWTALYEGTYTSENLPPVVPPDATLELAKCQVFDFRIYGKPYGIVGVGKVINDTSSAVYVNLPTMRGMPEETPTVTYRGTFIISLAGGSSAAVTAITIDSWANSTNGVSLNVTHDRVSSIAGQAVFLQFDNDESAYIEFNRDL